MCKCHRTLSQIGWMIDISLAKKIVYFSMPKFFVDIWKLKNLHRQRNQDDALVLPPPF